MDARETARRSDALYADGVRYHRRDLCDMIAYREADIERLEVALDTAVEDASSVYSYIIGKYMAENTRLRNLATGLYRCWMGEGCDGCPMQDSDGWCIRDLQLRELRIEVGK